MKNLYFFRYATPRRVAVFGLVFLLLMLTVQIMLFTHQREELLQSRAMVEHSYKQIQEITRIFNKISDIEANQLSFLLTGDATYLDVYRHELKPVDDGHNDASDMSLHELMHGLGLYYLNDKTGQKEHFDILNDLLSKKIVFMERTMTARMQRDPADRAEWAELEKGKALMDQIRTHTAVMMQTEQARLKDNIQTVEINRKRLTLCIGMLAAMSYFSLLLALLVIVRFFLRVQKSENRLQLQEKWFRAAMDGGMDGFFMFYARRDEAGHMVDLLLEYLNPAAEKMIGQKLHDIVNFPIDEILYPEQLGHSIFALYREIWERQIAMEREYAVPAGPLAGRILHKQVIPLPDGLAVTCRDVTERRQMEQMKSEFVSTVSHELRTPLTSIRGSLALVTGGVMGDVPETVRSLMTIAYNNCERLVRLINDILDVEKIEAGKMNFDCKPVELPPVLRQAIQDNLSFAEKYGVTLVLKPLPENLPCIMSDPDRLIQILTNLISNAIKFSAAGSDVTLACHPVGNKVRIDVTDYGCGIPHALRGRIFEKFVQADSSDTRQNNGTGLGLAITKALVEQMQGDIGFDTTEGEGTVFHVIFPALTESPVSEDEAVAPSVLFDKPCILICEDDPDIANLLKIVLEKADFTTDHAVTAQIAYQKLQLHDYAAMTLDLVLPDRPGNTFGDGLLFIHKIRNTPRLADLPIIVVSARAEEGHTMFTGSAVGILDWLSKPIAVDRLVSIVRNLSASARPVILHVEDDNDIARVMSLTLAPIAETVRATSLQQARQCLRGRRFDLVVLDVGLPDGNGTDLLPLLKQPDGAMTPVVLFTASDVTREISQTVAATLVKSRTSEASLLETIRYMIAQRNA